MDSIEYVVCTDGHIENIGNLNLFPKATFIVGFSIVREDTEILHDFINVSVLQTQDVGQKTQNAKLVGWLLPIHTERQFGCKDPGHSLPVVVQLVGPEWWYWWHHTYEEGAD